MPTSTTGSSVSISKIFLFKNIAQRGFVQWFSLTLTVLSIESLADGGYGNEDTGFGNAEIHATGINGSRDHTPAGVPVRTRTWRTDRFQRGLRRAHR
jgi:hypothetical protein